MNFPDDLNNWKKEDFEKAAKVLKQDSIDIVFIKNELKNIITVEDFLEKM